MGSKMDIYRFINASEDVKAHCREIGKTWDMLEHQLNTNFNLDSHGCFIPEDLLAENRLTPDEKNS